MAREAARVAHRCELARDTGHLDLSSCDLTNVPDGAYVLIRGGEVIRSANLSGNFLKTIPTKFAQKLSTLTDIILCENKITNLPASFGSLLELKSLDISKNNFTAIPDSVYALSSLETLKVNDNKINSVNIERLKEMSNLKQLSILGNDLPENYFQQIDLDIAIS